jgi:hypothetical protein
MQSAPTDKLPKPPQGGGKSKEQSGFRSAERCLRSLSRQIPSIAMNILAEDTIKPDGVRPLIVDFVIEA